MSLGNRLLGELTPPGDKSLSHRALLFAALAEGTSVIRGLNPGADVASTRTVLEALGTAIARHGDTVTVEGRRGRFVAPGEPLDCGNSGTTMRLFAGALAGQAFGVTLTGDGSLSRRPMERVAAPLREMGAAVETTGGHAPVRIEGRALRGANVVSPVSSAQVKSAVVIAGLFAEGTTTIVEPMRSRDHTERMLVAMGADLRVEGNSVAVSPGKTLRSIDFTVPGDPSAAAFFVCAAAALPGSRLLVRNMGLNPSRVGFLRVLERMGAAFEVRDHGEVCGEPAGDLEVTGRTLRGTTIEAEEIPSLVDEIPALSIIAASAGTPTIVRGAAELRVKETDRLSALAQGLEALGAEVREQPDGLELGGTGFTSGGTIDARGDHRIAMSFALASFFAPERVVVNGAETAAISDPGFWETLERLRRT